MLEYLIPYDGPVFEGLEHREVVYAKEQAQYIPVRTLVSVDSQKRAISRWALTPEQRKAIADGADLYLVLATFGHPLYPIQMFVTDGKDDFGQGIGRVWIKRELLGEPECPADKAL